MVRCIADIKICLCNEGLELSRVGVLYGRSVLDDDGFWDCGGRTHVGYASVQGMCNITSLFASSGWRAMGVMALVVLPSRQCTTLLHLVPVAIPPPSPAIPLFFPLVSHGVIAADALFRASMILTHSTCSSSAFSSVYSAASPTSAPAHLPAHRPSSSYARSSKASGVAFPPYPSKYPPKPRSRTPT